MNDADDDFEEEWHELRECEPFDWPGRQLVEQDNMGDWGFWLMNFDGWLEHILQDPGADVTLLAHSISEEYIAECAATGYPVPGDYHDGDFEAARAEGEAAIKEEFTVYLRTWQAAVAAKRQRGVLWTPGVAALAILVKPGEVISELIWKERLKDQIRGLAKQHEDPTRALEREWLDRYGSIPSMRRPEDIVDSAEFEDVLLERHPRLTFPIKVEAKPEPLDEGINNLEEWTMHVVRSLDDLL